MLDIDAAAATVPPGWSYGVAGIAVGGAVLPFLISLVPDAVALGVQRRRWRLLVGTLAAIGAAYGVLEWTLSLAVAASGGSQVVWPEFVELLFLAGLVVALWHGLPRVMRSVLRRRREDRESMMRAGVLAAPAAPAASAEQVAHRTEPSVPAEVLPA